MTKKEKFWYRLANVHLSQKKLKKDYQNWCEKVDLQHMQEKQRIKELWATYSSKWKFANKGVLEETAQQRRRRLEAAMEYNRKQIMTKIRAWHISYENFEKIK